MANLKIVRERITSVQNTQQITKAMKMVSAAKLRRAQQAVQKIRPYADKQNEMLRNILSNLGGQASTSFGVERPLKKACVVVVTSNRGLCGAFNTNVIKEAILAIEGKYAEARDSGNLTILPIGKKGNDVLRKRYPNATFNRNFVEIFSDLSFDNVAQVSQVLMDEFEAGNFDSITVAYGRFKNAATQFPEAEQWLPVPKMEATGDGNKALADYTFEPDMEGLLNVLVPSILQTTFQKYLLDTHASEHGARMTAMDKATENANEMLKDLKLMYNKARQEAITGEILEIVGGAAALESA
ncbi:MAG: ATP synthase F1 subunit gamma [Saprospiraceae bacterium]|nr:ATP synthase F1 subunit gamma [Saprospiraceae bacterium]MCF8251820.1 ATP synthase F1 subunit gamma [Saprospiraceae bacterium]MCF8281971.1 ATP synthase F1 subunit gamma [Bacteroidales bacterium]MCF8313294.1 ATP synthase F1 subunit gamma [Saprospiraceae bacterium]MCF8441750.1 ATP synthase F1 subunit gamma [Saprospiraceae bacterium]